MSLASLLLGITLLAYHFLAVHDHKWKVVDGGLVVDWDDPENSEQVKETC